ncbi:MAG: hypothetical protein JWO10_1212 [Microbacteriaceae bacterium]|nr:hypothetical protein [Microbacteriaceae bacterium]
MPANVAMPEDAEHATAHPADPRTRPGIEAGVVVAMSAALWWPAFTLGAWGTLFFDQLLTVWAAATAAFFVVLLQPRGERHRIRRAAALLVPTLWLVLELISNPETSNVFTDVVDLIGAIVGLLGIPATLWVLARMIWPNLGKGISRARSTLMLIAITLIAVASFELGVHQAAFLRCDDFSISGNSLPPGCVTDSPSPTPTGKP